MRVITITIHKDSEAENAFSIIDQSLNDAGISANISLSYENTDADSGAASIRPAIEGLPSGG